LLLVRHSGKAHVEDSYYADSFSAKSLDEPAVRRILVEVKLKPNH
jgi:hypothetical protein